MNNVDHDKKTATSDKLGNITSKNQNGLTAKGKPRKAKPAWKFGESCKDIVPTKIV